MKLIDLPINTDATITNVSTERLVSMGFRIGYTIRIMRKTYNGMIHCRVNTTEFAIRSSVAEEILVR